MPLKKGTSRKTRAENIETEMDEYKKSGTIGNSKPKSKKKAQKQAVAIAYSKARDSGAKLPKKKAAAKKSSAKKTTKKKPGPNKGSTKSASKKRS